jgi:hypothetical protein
MRKNAAGYVFHEWTRARKAKFVDLRLQGMHVHWAVFWALINRNQSRSVYSAEDVKKYWATGEHPAHFWRKEMGAVTHFDVSCMPPKELFDALAVAEGDQLKKDAS